MRQLSFLGFLTKYLKELSYSGSNNIFKLAREAQSNNARIYEPLFLYALFADKVNIFLSATKNMKQCSEFKGLSRYNKDEMIELLENNSSNIKYEYQKVYNSYLAEKNKVKNDAHTKQLMRNKILKLKSEKKVSNYRIYTDLNLNPGNMNAFLKQGDTNKISLQTARMTIDYLQQL